MLRRQTCRFRSGLMSSLLPVSRGSLSLTFRRSYVPSGHGVRGGVGALHKGVVQELLPGNRKVARVPGGGRNAIAVEKETKTTK